MTNIEIEESRRLRYGQLGNQVHSFFLFLALMLLITSAAHGTELRIPELQGKSGQEIQLPIIIDQTGNLAGLKLIIHYNKELLTFKEGVKTPSTQSLMHIINDKNPGKLIVVMAGARGIQGKDITIINLIFSIKKGLTENHKSAIEIAELQLMGDDLREIPARVKHGTILVMP